MGDGEMSTIQIQNQTQKSVDWSVARVKTSKTGSSATGVAIAEHIQQARSQTLCN